MPYAYIPAQKNVMPTAPVTKTRLPHYIPTLVSCLVVLFTDQKCRSSLSESTHVLISYLTAKTKLAIKVPLDY